jgi:hypothetical protein
MDLAVCGRGSGVVGPRPDGYRLGPRSDEHVMANLVICSTKTGERRAHGASAQVWPAVFGVSERCGEARPVAHAEKWLRHSRWRTEEAYSPTSQELLGRAGVSTTMIHTDVLNRRPAGVRIPADRLVEGGGVDGNQADLRNVAAVGWGRREVPCWAGCESLQRERGWRYVGGGVEPLALHRPVEY